jgi:hypothetical protein
MFKEDGELGAEDFGPPEPTGTQLVVQASRDVLTSKVPMTSTTLMYILGGAGLLYLVYHYMYSTSEA